VSRQPRRHAQRPERLPARRRVTRLVYVSSASVVYDGSDSIENGDESPALRGHLPRRTYAETKRIAEEEVLARPAAARTLAC
jgi:nucleoside-diphosphate-sugar epimerase